jgi:AraC family transcriptional regulator
VTESIYRSEQSITRHQHENAYFCAVLRGSYLENSDGREIVCGPQTSVFRAGGEVHSDLIQRDGAHLVIIEMAPSFLARSSEIVPKLKSSPQPQRGLMTYLATKLSVEARQTDTAAPLAMEGLALEMLAGAARVSQGLPEAMLPRWLKHAQELLHERFTEHLELSNIADAVNVHPVHLACVFRRTFRCTPGEYLRQLRVQYACRQLSETNASISEIALAAGFCDQSHFNRHFKRLLGLTPAQYRRSIVL